MPVLKDTKATQEPKDTKEMLVLKATLVPKDTKAMQEPKVLKAT